MPNVHIERDGDRPEIGDPYDYRVKGDTISGEVVAHTAKGFMLSIGEEENRRRLAALAR